jgi:hypothetical protein
MAKHVNWKSNAQIEQDLVIERALIELFSNKVIRENLAFRGGTALHKIFLKPPLRYSEDIDLVQINPGPIKPLMEEIGKAMSFLGNKRSIKQNVNMNTVVYRFQTEIAPVVKCPVKTGDKYPGTFCSTWLEKGQSQPSKQLVQWRCNVNNI